MTNISERNRITISRKITLNKCYRRVEIKFLIIVYPVIAQINISFLILLQKKNHF